MSERSEQENKAISASLEGYLEAIFTLEQSDGAARASAIADIVGVSRSTVTSTLKTLKSMELVEYSPYSLVKLTPEGRRIGRDIAHRHVVFQEFFEYVLQMDQDIADQVACSMEHIVPPELIRRMGQFVLYLKTREDQWRHWQDDYLREEIAKRGHGRFNRDGEPAVGHDKRGRVVFDDEHS